MRKRTQPAVVTIGLFLFTTLFNRLFSIARTFLTFRVVLKWRTFATKRSFVNSRPSATWRFYSATLNKILDLKKFKLCLNEVPLFRSRNEISSETNSVNSLSDAQYHHALHCHKGGTAGIITRKIEIMSLIFLQLEV